MHWFYFPLNLNSIQHSSLLYKRFPVLTAQGFKIQSLANKGTTKGPRGAWGRGAWGSMVLNGIKIPPASNIQYNTSW